MKKETGFFRKIRPNLLGFSSSSFLYQPVSHRLYLLDVSHPPNDYWPTDLGFKDTIRLGRGEKNSREARGPDYVQCFLSNPPFLSLLVNYPQHLEVGRPARWWTATQYKSPKVPSYSYWWGTSAFPCSLTTSADWFKEKSECVSDQLRRRERKTASLCCYYYQIVQVFLVYPVGASRAIRHRPRKRVETRHFFFGSRAFWRKLAATLFVRNERTLR